MPLNNNVGTGKSIATGTYTGNGAAVRQISLGFKVMFAVVVNSTTQVMRWIAIPSMTVGDKSVSDNADRTSTMYIHATDGLVVDTNDQSNTLNDVYYYYAIG